AARALGQGPLGAAPALAHRAQAALHVRARGARLAHALLGAVQLVRQRRGSIARQLKPRFEHLPLQPRVQVRRLGLALERAQPRARLALDVERAVEVLLRALELQARAPAALAVLAEPRRLLDQQAALARLGRDDLLHAALRYDRVRLLAQPGVRQSLDHVGQPAAGAVETVGALARALQAPQDRYLAEGQID